MPTVETMNELKKDSEKYYISKELFMEKNMNLSFNKKGLICENPIPIKPIPMNPVSEKARTPGEIISLLMEKMVLNNGGKLK
jgi:hypothetical protein